MRKPPSLWYYAPFEHAESDFWEEETSLVIWNFEKKVPEIVAKMRLFMIAEI